MPPSLEQNVNAYFDRAAALTRLPPGLLDQIRACDAVCAFQTAAPRTCTPDTTLAAAANLMWQCDCGVLPVVDDGELVGIVTDRDMFIALGTRNTRAALLRVGAVATTKVVTCRADDEVEAAA